MTKPRYDRSGDDMPVLPEGIHPIEPDGGQEWIIAHIRKLENSVDDILFALRAGGYTMSGELPVPEKPEPTEWPPRDHVNWMDTRPPLPPYGIISAPFTPQQAAALNQFQGAGSFHPFTCGNDLCPGVSGMHASLVAAEDGWHCPACTYTQDWAHAFMADGSWLASSGITGTVDGEPVRGEIGEIPVTGDYYQSETACCPRETIPDSCSCPDGCGCNCLDCDCPCA